MYTWKLGWGARCASLGFSQYLRWQRKAKTVGNAPWFMKYFARVSRGRVFFAPRHFEYHEASGDTFGSVQVLAITPSSTCQSIPCSGDNQSQFKDKIKNKPLIDSNFKCTCFYSPININRKKRHVFLWSSDFGASPGLFNPGIETEKRSWHSCLPL